MTRPIQTLSQARERVQALEAQLLISESQLHRALHEWQQLRRLPHLLAQQCRKLEQLGRPRLFTRSVRAWWREQRASEQRQAREQAAGGAE